ncbi:MAG: hypothetical protein AAFP79_12280 [Pseudomonadota bacterium]
MQTTFNTASLAKLSKSELYALLAEYRARLSAAAPEETAPMRAAINAIENALKGPG